MDPTDILKISNPLSCFLSSSFNKCEYLSPKLSPHDPDNPAARHFFLHALQSGLVTALSKARSLGEKSRREAGENTDEEKSSEGEQRSGREQTNGDRRSGKQRNIEHLLQPTKFEDRTLPIVFRDYVDSVQLHKYMMTGREACEVLERCTPQQRWLAY